MNELIYRAFHGRVTNKERELLQAWRAASEENEELHNELWSLLSDTRDLASLFSETAAAPPPVDLLAVSEPVEVLQPEPQRALWGRSRIFSLAIAAGLAVLMAANYLADLGGSRGMMLGTGEIVTGAAEMTSVRLADGTIVRLAPSSRLRLSDERGVREVWLDGRGYFAVAKHAGVPFRVRTRAGDAMVLGTRFDLEARDEKLHLLVVEGAVNVAAAGESMDVAASQAATVTRESGPVVATVDDDYVQEELTWLGDFLVFDDTPLSQVARELTAHFDVPVEVLDSALAEQTVRGMFVEETLDSVIGQLCQALSAYCSITASGVTISP